MIFHKPYRKGNKMEKKVESKKIEYAKPEILDLGPVSPIHGGTCGAGSLNTTGDCLAGAIAAGGYCNTGAEAATGT
jgi:hypothetical protein